MSITQKEIDAFLEDYRRYLLVQIDELKNILQTLPIYAVERAFSHKDVVHIADKLRYYYSMYQIGPHALKEILGKNKINFSK